MSPVTLSIIQRLRVRENHIFLALSIIIGVLSGLAAVLFTLAIKGTTQTLFGIEPSTLRFILVPTLMSLVTGFLLVKFFPEARGSGVPQTEAAYHLNQGQVPFRVAVGKFLTGVLCIGSGHSMGREGPSVQIAAGIASPIGKWFNLSPARRQSLIPVAAAAALSAAFNTPVAAIIFALEEIIGDKNAALLGSTVVASVAAVIVERSLLGNNPVFRVPAYRLESPAELVGYAILGIAGGIVSVAFCKGLLNARKLFATLPEWSKVLQPAMGGLLIGLILVFFPQAMGVGYQFVDQAMNGSMLLKTMLLLCLAKFVATIVSYSSGNAGGIFAPSLYLGAMAGGAVGILMHRFAPFPTADPGAYALVGMGTLFAGIVRAPMTSVFMIFELTQDYQVLVPLMLANMISYLISKKYQPIPLYGALMEQDHVHLPRIGTKQATTSWYARDVMTKDFTLLSPDSSIESASSFARQTNADSLLIGVDGAYSGLVRRSDIESALHSGSTNIPVGSLVKTTFAHVHPDHPFDLVLERLAKTPGLLPVVNRSRADRVEGVITPQTVIDFVQKEINETKNGTE